MTTTFAQRHAGALGLRAPAAAATAHPGWMILLVGLSAGLLMLGALVVTLTPNGQSRVARATVVGTTAVGTTVLSDHRVGEIGAGQVAISSAEGLRAFRAEEIALGSVPAIDHAARFAKAHAVPAARTVGATPLADQGYRDQRIGEIGIPSGGASGTSPERSTGK